MDWQLG